MVWVQFLALQIRKEPRLKVHQGRKKYEKSMFEILEVCPSTFK